MKLMIYAILQLKEQGPSPQTLLYASEITKGNKFSVIGFENLGVVVRDVTDHKPEDSKTEAIQYASVVELLATKFTLLPMRFGSIVESAGIITRMLERNLIGLNKSLIQVENKDEFGLKIFCDTDALRSEFYRQISVSTQTGTTLQNDAAPSVYRNYINEKLKEHRFEEMIMTKLETIITDIQLYTKQNEGIGKFKKNISANTLLDAVFLIRKDNKDRFLDYLSTLQARNPGWNFFITGPWPPYSFVEMSLK
jgi:hypothetical protein